MDAAIERNIDKGVIVVAIPPDDDVSGAIGVDNLMDEDTFTITARVLDPAVITRLFEMAKMHPENKTLTWTEGSGWSVSCEVLFKRCWCRQSPGEGQAFDINITLSMVNSNG